jgi:mono/diheme cytochrome c family protein
VRNLSKTVFFSLLVILAFAGFSNFVVPQLQPAPPPKEEVLDLSAMTMDQFVALGARLVEGKGTCTLCHNEVGGRAPLLTEAVAVTRERLADARYEGSASDSESYLIESMLEPSAFVVAGFGKAGSGDTESPMPDVSGGSIGLNEAEILAVIAYLQDLGGEEISVEIPEDAGAAAAEEEEDGEGREPFATVAEIIDEYTCGACHMVAGEEGDLGPDLNAIGSARAHDYLRRAILDPNADIAEGFEADLMPDDYGAQLFAGELEMLIEYLASQQGQGSEP